MHVPENHFGLDHDDVQRMRFAMVQAAAEVANDSDKKALAASVENGQIDYGRFEVIARRVLDPDGSFANDPVTYGLCKFVQYSDENGGLSPGDCLDIAITLKRIRKHLPADMESLFERFRLFLEETAKAESSVEFIEP